MRKSVFFQQICGVGLWIAAATIWPVSSGYAQEVVGKPSNSELRKGLLENENMFLPFYLGCDQLTTISPKLPITCLQRGMEIFVDELPTRGLAVGEILRNIPTSSDWVHAKSLPDKTVGLEFEMKVTDYWSVRQDGRSILCALGRPIDLVVQEKFQSVGRCYLAFDPPSYGDSKGRVILIDLRDRGRFAPWGANNFESNEYLRAFLSLFALDTFALSK